MKRKNIVILILIIIIAVILTLLLNTYSNRFKNDPKWIRDLLENNRINNSSISRCVYNYKTVYYIQPLNGSDMYDILYNYNGERVCAPSGGFGGGGDGRCTNFNFENCEFLGYSSKSFGIKGHFNEPTSTLSN